MGTNTGGVTDGVALVVFLGNPGPEYRDTRHNAAWTLVPRLPWSGRLSWLRKFKGEYASAEIAGARRHFLKPSTFMNRSGDSVGEALRFFRLPTAALLVVHDDVEIRFGEIAVKLGGGAAGHNGLRSIAASVSADFFRLKIGVGRPPRGDVSSHVLGKFSPGERDRLPDVLDAAARLLELAIANPDAAVGAGRIEL